MGNQKILDLVKSKLHYSMSIFLINKITVKNDVSEHF